MSIDFTVIISLHKKDRADWFEQAARSVLDQTVKPSVMIITVDGVIGRDHDRAIANLKLDFPAMSIIELRRKYGDRGRILYDAVERAETSLVAIMDADDIAEPARFEKQLKVFEEIVDVDVVGSWVREISPSDHQYECTRAVPTAHKQIASYALSRNPINNMTVMFKREKIIAAGNYLSMKNFADYWLWVRVLNNGGRFANIDETLVTARAAEGLASRRRGIAYIKSEIVFFYNCYSMGYMPFHRFFLNLILRLPVRLLPAPLFNLVLKSRLRR